MQDPLLSVDALQVGYNGKTLLPPISFSVCSGEIWALFGPNGGGKSTLLRTLLEQQPALAGSFSFLSRNISAVAQRQRIDPLVPGRTRDIIQAGDDRGWSFLRPWRDAAARRRFDAAARDTNATPLLDQQYQELSEGQKQRALIARALISEPRILTLDEPTSAMDPFHEAAVFRLLREVTDRRGLGVIVASHHMHFLTEVADHAVYVDSERGAVISGTFEEVAREPVVVQRYGDLLAHESCYDVHSNAERVDEHSHRDALGEKTEVAR